MTTTEPAAPAELVNLRLAAALQDALPVLRDEYMKLAEKYAGTPFENDLAYKAVKARYDNAKDAIQLWNSRVVSQR